MLVLDGIVSYATLHITSFRRITWLHLTLKLIDSNIIVLYSIVSRLIKSRQIIMHHIVSYLTSVYIYLRQGGYVFGRVCLSVHPSICLSVRLSVHPSVRPSVREQNNSKSNGCIWMKFSGNVQHGKRKNWFDFGVDPDQHLAAMMKNVIFVNNYWTKIDIIMNPVANGMFSWSRNLNI